MGPRFLTALWPLSSHPRVLAPLHPGALEQLLESALLYSFQPTDPTLLAFYGPWVR